ncbi:MAG: rhodanese-like domain-containing protein [Actinomycetota bacterium]|nr:rhodanese-like domain-containing protein [Actinomycetota bacterium]
MRLAQLDEVRGAQIRGDVIIDVREAYEYAQGHVHGALNIPLSLLQNRLDEIPKGRDVYVICQSGSRSLTGATILSRAGIDAASVVGGTSGWKDAGFAVVA